MPGAPDAPVISNITDTTMDVSWKPPAQDGGSPVIEYFLEQKLSSDFKWSPVTTSQIVNTEFNANQLKTGKTYQFRVAAANLAGTGKWSQPSSDNLCKAPIGMTLL